MAGKKSSMIDDDFIDDGEEEHSFRDDSIGEFVHDVSLPEPSDKDKDKDKSKEKDELVIEVASDTPDKDKGRWVADDGKDGEPEFPSEDEIKNYSKDVQNRISKLTARTHAERRRADDLSRQLEAAAKFADDMLKRNNQLSALVEDGEKVLVSEHKSRLEAQLTQAKNAYREAHEAGDVAGMTAAQESLAKAAAALDRVSVHRPAPLPRVQQEEFDTVFKAPAAQPQKVDDQTRQWQEKNQWFGKDALMTAFAMGVHTELTKNKGIMPSDPEYWSSINKEMQKRFPERFQSQTAPRRTETIVAPVQRTGIVNPKKVTLTESQVKLAKRLGLTVEQYARQVMKEQLEKD